jgi:methylthioribose-1-phosphate isomerase
MHFFASEQTSRKLPKTLWWDKDNDTLCMIDQTLLPNRVEVIICRSAQDVIEAISSLRVRGAPAIGVAASYGMVLGAHEIIQSQPAEELEPGTFPQAVREAFRTLAERLIACRPTAVNLAWAVGRMVQVSEQIPEISDNALIEFLAALLKEAHRIAAEDAAACLSMGRHGATLISDGDTLLTHCNAGALATSGIGTALAPVYIAYEMRRRIHVFVDETRPVLQGARLTAWELHQAGIPCTLITDNMAAYFLGLGKIDAIFVGADRITANGDVANKIGTYGLSILAHEHGVPFYVVAPRSTIDLSLPSGNLIPIEERAPEEVTRFGGVWVAPQGVDVANPAFDVTPARYVTAFVTEAGIAYPPYELSLIDLMSNMSASDNQV